MTQHLIAGLFAFSALAPSGASAQDHEAVNEAKNPLTPKITINLQDYCAPRWQMSQASISGFQLEAP